MKRPLVILSILWLLATLARFAFFYDLRQAVGVFLDWAPGLFVLLCGVALAIAWLVQIFRSRPRRPILLLPAAGLVALMILLWGMRLGPRIGVAAKLWRVESEYLEVVTAIRKDPAADPPDCSARLEIEPGPPLRVAFSWGGVLDNWTGIVHDPGGGVLTANQPGNSSGSSRLFGGTLIHARHVWGPWYFCVFT